MNNAVLEEDTCKGVLEELFSLSDTEVKKCFVGCSTPHEVLNKYSLASVSKKLQEYAASISADGKKREKNFNSVGESPVKTLEKVVAVPETVTLHWLLGQDEGFTEEELQGMLAEGTRLTGTVLWYDWRKSTGWLFRQNKGTLHNFRITREGMSNTLNSRLTLGDKVEFTPFLDEFEKISAKDVVRVGSVEKPKRGITIHDDFCVYPNEIIRYGKSNSMNRIIRQSEGRITKRTVYTNSYTQKDFDYVYILTKNRGEFEIYRSGSPMKGDGQVEDLNVFMRMLDQRLLHFTYAPSLEATRAQRIANREIDLENKKKKEDALFAGAWFRVRFVAEAMKVGLTKDEAKVVLQKLGNVEKHFRKGSLAATEECVIEKVKSYTRKMTKTPSADKKVAWFRGVVLSEFIRKGMTQKAAKTLLNERGFNEFMAGKKWSDLRDTDPYALVKRIQCYDEKAALK